MGASATSAPPCGSKPSACDRAPARRAPRRDRRRDQAHSETRYRIDDAQLAQAFRAAQDFDRELVAIYHSHPRSPAYPSPTDRAEAQWPLAAYVLVSLRVATPEVFAYRISDGAVREIPIVEATA